MAQSTQRVLKPANPVMTKGVQRRLVQGFFLVLMEGMTAFVLPSKHLSSKVRGNIGVSHQFKDTNTKLHPERSVHASTPIPLRMMQSDDAAVQSIQNWPEVPKDSRIVSCPSSSDAAVMSTFFSEFRRAKDASAEQTIIVSRGSNLESMSRICSYLQGICPQSKVAVVAGAPQPCISFRNCDKSAIASKAEADESNQDTIGDKEVMGKILDWFTELLIGMDDEEEYIDIGRRLLSVNRYAVNSARSVEALHEVFWKEVSTAVEGREGNTLIVLPHMLLDNSESFLDIVNSQLKAPLLAWASGTKELRVAAYHPSTAGATSPGPPWPLIEIYLHDPAPSAQEVDASFNDVMEQPRPVGSDETRPAMSKFPLNLQELTDTSDKKQ